MVNMNLIQAPSDKFRKTPSLGSVTHGASKYEANLKSAFSRIDTKIRICFCSCVKNGQPEPVKADSVSLVINSMLGGRRKIFAVLILSGFKFRPTIPPRTVVAWSSRSIFAMPSWASARGPADCGFSFLLVAASATAHVTPNIVKRAMAIVLMPPSVVRKRNPLTPARFDGSAIRLTQGLRFMSANGRNSSIFLFLQTVKHSPNTGGIITAVACALGDLVTSYRIARTGTAPHSGCRNSGTTGTSYGIAHSSTAPHRWSDLRVLCPRNSLSETRHPIGETRKSEFCTMSPELPVHLCEWQELQHFPIPPDRETFSEYRGHHKELRAPLQWSFPGTGTLELWLPELWNSLASCPRNSSLISTGVGAAADRRAASMHPDFGARWRSLWLEAIRSSLYA